MISGLKIYCILLLLIFWNVDGYSQIQASKESVKKDIQSEINKTSTKQDSLVSYRRTHSLDSVGVSYENGQLNTPKLDRPTISSRNLESVRASMPLPSDSVSRVLRDDRIPSMENFSNKVVEQTKNQQHPVSDSLSQIVESFDEFRDINSSSKIYSKKTLKKIYDSLGISKLDTLRAMMTPTREVSKEALLQEINSSFKPGLTLEDTKNLDGSLKNIDLPQGDDIPQLDLATLKLPAENLQELSPLRGYNFSADSLPMIDSLRQLNLQKDKLLMKTEQVSDKVKKAIVVPEPNFIDRTYWEGHLGFLQTDKFKLLQFSPTLGYHVSPNLSFGAGPNISLKEQNRKWQVMVAYRTFMKYALFEHRAYFQGEYVVDPLPLGGKENGVVKKSSILLGGGYLQPLSKNLAINICLMYRINHVTPEYNSPWVFRMGFSSIKSGKRDK